MNEWFDTRLCGKYTKIMCGSVVQAYHQTSSCTIAQRISTAPHMLDFALQLVFDICWRLVKLPLIPLGEALQAAKQGCCFFASACPEPTSVWHFVPLCVCTARVWNSSRTELAIQMNMAQI